MTSLMELIAQKKAALKSGNRQKTVKPSEGRSRWRILPSWRPAGAEGSDQFWHDFGQHFIKDNTGAIKAVYVCVDKTYGKPCQVCDALQTAIRSSGDDAMVNMLKEAGAGHRILVNALQVDGDNPTEPAILELAPGVFAEVLNIISEWGADVLDLANGKDIVIERTGKGKLTKYSVQIGAKSQPVDPSVMKKVVNLDEYVAQESEEQAKRAIANLNAVAGMLPAPSAGTGKPSLSDLSVDDVDDAALAALEGVSAKVPEAAPAKVTEEPAKVTEEPAKAAAVEPSQATTGDSELDDLLAELG